MSEPSQTRSAKWYARANESSFKPTSGGYVFQAPSPWVFRRPKYYLVTEAQKAELLEGLAVWRLRLMLASLVNLVVIFGFVLPMAIWPKTLAPFFLPLFRALGPVGLVVVVSAVMMVLLTPLIVVAQVHLARVLRTALAGAPLTDERIRIRDQLPKIATSVPGPVIAMGLIGGTLMLAGGLLQMIDAYQEGHLGRTAPLSGFALGFGALLTAYFAYLLRLRAKRKQAAAAQ